VHRVRQSGEAVLADELAALAAVRGARYVLVEGLGSREPRLLAAGPGRHLTDAQALREIVPDLAEHDVYLCGCPAGWTPSGCGPGRRSVPPSSSTLERFTY
jgi:hypothetical protein